MFTHDGTEIGYKIGYQNDVIRSKFSCKPILDSLLLPLKHLCTKQTVQREFYKVVNLSIQIYIYIKCLSNVCMYFYFHLVPFIPQTPSTAFVVRLKSCYLFILFYSLNFSQGYQCQTKTLQFDSSKLDRSFLCFKLCWLLFLVYLPSKTPLERLLAIFYTFLHKLCVQLRQSSE